MTYRKPFSFASFTSFAPLNHLVALAAALALAVTLSAPRTARADPGDAVAAGIIGLAIYCGATGKCTNTKRTGRTGGARGPVDAIALTGQNAMLVQAGLQNLGLYNGPIDGAIGGGTRAAIRAYQATIGAPQTGVLTGQQINDLAALSPGYFDLPAGDPFLFTADLASDLDRNGVRQLQAALNQRGYAAGAVDGAFGGQTRNAIAAYKASYGLGGNPVASRRLLAHLMGWAPPEPAGKAVALARRGITPAAQAPMAAPAAVPATADRLRFDILGVELGMSEAEVKGTLMARLGGELMFDTADAATIGAGGAPVSRAFLTTQADWPAPSSEQVMALFDEARPDLGAVAVFRMIRMPDGVDQAAFEAGVLPDILANYGDAGLLRQAGILRWIGDPEAREGDVSMCGQPRLTVDTGVANALDALWRSGGGPRLDGGLGVGVDCGEVLSVDYSGSVVRIGLWNSGALMGGSTAGGVPKIKF